MPQLTITYFEADGQRTEAYRMDYIGYVIAEKLARAKVSRVKFEWQHINETYKKLKSGWRLVCKK